MQFVDGRFVDSYYPTIENTFSKTIQYKGQDFATEIVDTAGQVSTAGQLCTVAARSSLLQDGCGLGRIQHSQLEALYRHPWIHARLLSVVPAIV